MESKKMKSESVVPGEQKKTEFALGKTNIILIADGVRCDRRRFPAYAGARYYTGGL